MSITRIKGQALPMIPAAQTVFNDNNCGGSYCVKVVPADNTPFQVDLTQVSGTELVRNSSFDAPLSTGTTTSTSGSLLIDAGATFLSDGLRVGMTVKNQTDTTYDDIVSIDSDTQLTLGSALFTSGENYEISGWSFNSDPGNGADIDDSHGTAKKTAGNASGPTGIPLQVYPNSLYKVVMVVSSYSVGTIVANLGNVSMPGMTATGTYTHYVQTGNAPDNDFEVAYVSADDIAISSVSIVAITDVGVRVKDSTGTVVYSEIDHTSVTFNPGDAATTTLSPKAQIDFDWTGVTNNACYNLCLFDAAYAADLIEDGVFSEACDINWTCQSGWTIGAGVAVYVASVGNEDLTQTLIIPKGYSYTLSVNFTALTSGDLEVYTDEGLKGTISPGGTGVETVTIDLTASASDQTFITLTGDSLGGYSIDDVSLTITDVDDLPDILVSEDICLNATHKNDLVLTWTNDDNYSVGTSNIDYTNFTLTQQLRVEAFLHSPIYPSRKKVTSLESDGSRHINFSSFEEQWKFELERSPDYIHLAVRVGLEHDDFYIDGTEYVFIEEDYDPSWAKFEEGAKLAKVVFPVVEQDQLFVNASC